MCVCVCVCVVDTSNLERIMIKIIIEKILKISKVSLSLKK